MMHKRLLVAAAALALGVSALPAFAQSSAGDTKASPSTPINKRNCDELMGAAKDACLKGQIEVTPRTSGRSEDAASREGGRTPGRSEDATSPTGFPPEQVD